MAKLFSLRQILRKKTAYFQRKLAAYRIKKSKPGRPKKPRQPIQLEKMSFEELLKKPAKIQTYDEFSEIPKQILCYFAGDSTEEKYKTWINQNFFPFQEEETKSNIFYEFQNTKQKFSEFMLVVLKRTRESLGLTKLAGDMLGMIFDNFVEATESFGKKANPAQDEIVKAKVMRLFRGSEINHYVGTKIKGLFNEVFFQGVLDALNKWKKVFDEEFA